MNGEVLDTSVTPPVSFSPPRYVLQQSGYEYEFLEGMDATNSDPIGLGGEIIYELNFGIPDRNRDQQIFSADWDASDDEEVALTSANSSPSLILASRILIDAYFEMESYLQLVLTSTKIAFNRFAKEYNTSDDTIAAANMFYTTGGKGRSKSLSSLQNKKRQS